MLKEIQQRLKRHTQGLFAHFIFVVSIALVLDVGFFVYEANQDRIHASRVRVAIQEEEILDLAEKNSPRTDWFEYEVGNEVNPAKPSYHYTEVPEFMSNETYHQDIDMVWEDTLWCEAIDKNGELERIKRKTQHWAERKHTGSQPEKWGYTEDSIPERAERCQICGDIIGTTPRGHEKSMEYCSGFFEVTKITYE